MLSLSEDRCCEKGRWRLLHNNTPAHRSTLITDFSTGNGILTIKHYPYSPDLAPCDFYLFGKLRLAMKGKFGLNIIPTDQIKMSFNSLLDRSKRCIESKGDFLNKINQLCQKHFLFSCFLACLSTFATDLVLLTNVVI